jgi:hypothetical protein
MSSCVLDATIRFLEKSEIPQLRLRCDTECDFPQGGSTVTRQKTKSVERLRLVQKGGGGSKEGWVPSRG